MNQLPDSNSWRGQEFDQSRVPVGPRETLPWKPEYSAYAGHEGDYGQGETNIVHDLLKYFWIVVRHRWVVLGIAVGFLCAGLLITLLTTPIYRASTTVQIDREPAKVVNMAEVETDLGSDAAFYATQFEVLKSRTMAENVVSTFSVEELQQFTQPRGPTLAMRIRNFVSTSHVEDEEDVDVPALQRAAAGKVLAGLAVQPVGNSRLVRLSFEDPSPAWAQKIANGVANTFLALTLDRRFDASAYARKFLEERLQEFKLKLQDSEEELVAYAQAQRIVNVDERRSLVSANLEALNAQLAATSQQRLKTEELLRQAEATNGLGLPQVLADETIAALRGKRAELATEYQDKLGLFKPAYPDMMKLKARIDEIDRQIQGSVEIVKASLRAEYESARAEEARLTQQVEALKTETLDLAGRGIQYGILQREVDTNRELYNGLLQRFKEVGVAGAVGTNNVTIVDSAALPGGPVKPSLSMNLTLALGLGLVCGGLAAFGIEFLDDTFKVPEDVESKLGLPVLGIIPIVQTAEGYEQAMGDPRSPMSEAYRSLRTALQFSTAEGAPKSLLVTSSRPGEGKSTTAVSLAKNFSELGMKVLLIDSDLRNPSLHKRLNVSASDGLSQYLTGGKVRPGTFQEVGVPGLTFMSSGPLPPNPAELLAGPKMSTLLTVSAQKFDVIIVDGPPVMGLADAPLLASVATGTLLVVEAGETRRALAKGALKRLHFARAQMVGVLLSKFDASKVGHTYGYGYGYGDTDYYGYGSDSTPKLTQTAA